MTSADLIAELQSARPTAGTALREHVRAISVTQPARRPSPFARLSRLSPRRFALVAIPATAVVLLGLAGVGGLLDSGSSPEQLNTALESRSQATPPASARELAPLPKTGVAGAADASTPSPTTGRAQRYSAQLTLSVKDVDALSDATQQALRITRDLGGYLVTVSYATSDSAVVRTSARATATSKPKCRTSCPGSARTTSTGSSSAASCSGKGTIRIRRRTSLAPSATTPSPISRPTGPPISIVRC